MYCPSCKISPFLSKFTLLFSHCVNVTLTKAFHVVVHVGAGVQGGRTQGGISRFEIS